MHPEQAIAALRFDPLLPVWLIVALGVLALLVVALGAWRRARGTLLAPRRLRRAAAVARRPAPGAGNPRNAARYRPAGGGPDRLDADRRPRQAGRGSARRDRGAGARSCPTSSCAPSPCRSKATPARGCSARSTARWPISRARAWPAPSPSPTAQIHDIPEDRARRRAAERADPGQGRGNRPPPARHRGARLRHRRQDGRRCASPSRTSASRIPAPAPPT